jgi:arginase
MLMNKTEIQLLLIPYDSGHRSLRMGAGPEHFLKNGLAEVLQSAGYDVSVETLEPRREFRAEVATQFELYGSLAERVAEARQNGRFPLILSGNCGATVGAIAGAGGTRLGVIWFDAHGEFNTPETTRSGFLDGMGLAIATGLCWKNLAASIPNFHPIAAEQILLIGGRDFDAGERERLDQAGAMVLDCAAIEQTGIRNALETPLSELSARVDEVHLHIDLDVLNPKEAPANGFLADDSGLSVQQIHEAIALIKEKSKITSATVASFDPTYDSQRKTRQAALDFMKQIVGRE